ncbi:MAG: low-specificity L-threonine aldolase [Candidatus Atribacteria bacterium]|nr:low-specificity L-threonine aldolase [Candidatus Atribacteria bacterium]
MEFVDLRSDTVTKPTPAMREAMAKAEVGDDVYGEDPTVNRLQEMAAEMMGKEAGLFVASGTMGNLAGVLAHCQRGDEVIVGNKAHTFLFEAGGISVLGGVHSCQLPNQPDGSLALEDIEVAIRPDDPHDPITRLICLENTHNRCGGTYQTPEYMNRVSEFARGRGLSVHLDGARIFNAAAVQGIKAKELAGPVDSVTFCLSKGLCAPVGSVLCGSKEFIRKAHRLRKMLGGGMRQAGILAAAGIVALETMTGRLSEDHARARKLADGLKQVPGLVLDPEVPATNMVFLSLTPEVKSDTSEVVEKLKRRGILAGVTGQRSFRLVLHYWIDDTGVKKTVAAFRAAVQ